MDFLAYPGPIGPGKTLEHVISVERILFKYIEIYYNQRKKFYQWLKKPVHSIK